MIGTGSFLRITSEIDIESQQTLYHSTPWPEWNITVPTVSRSDMMLRFGVPPRKLDFPQPNIKNSDAGLDSPSHPLIPSWG